jgi:hypothetical protein
MTFQEWYAANIEPTLPTDVPEPIRQNARESMAACWNAAIDATQERCRAALDVDDEAIARILDLKDLRAPVSPFEFERQRLRQ